MNIKQTKHELQNLISGKSSTSYDALIQAVSHYLGRSQKTSPMAEEKHQNKNKETKKLIRFATKNNLWITEINEEHFVKFFVQNQIYTLFLTYAFL